MIDRDFERALDRRARAARGECRAVLSADVQLRGLPHVEDLPEDQQLEPGDLVLVIGQADPRLNGLRIVGHGPWQRPGAE